jgi:aryl-alcohol dehydrogenase-like predicted oxidoreductase
MIHKFQRKFGRDGIQSSALGMGCWAIGGPMHMQGAPLGWGKVNDEVSKRAIRKAFEMGVNFFDTADMYGMGHSEKLLGEVLSKDRDQVILATKFGMTFNDQEITGFEGSPDYVATALEASLRRLKTDYIDLYQFHLADFPLEEARKIRDKLEELAAIGKIKGYAWSTDNEENARFFSEGPNCIAIQHEFNVFLGNEKILALCETKDLASINRGPLAMGILTGKYGLNSTFQEDDCRKTVDLYNDPFYMFFKEGKPVPELIQKLNAIQEILRSGGRTLAQGALGWLWAKSDKTIPIPGFKTVRQVEENANALDFGPLNHAQMIEIEELSFIPQIT